MMADLVILGVTLLLWVGAYYVLVWAIHKIFR